MEGKDELHKFMITVYLDGENTGDLWVEIPMSLYEQVKRDSPKISDNPEREIRIAKMFGLDPGNVRTFQHTMEEDYPEIAEIISKRISDAMYSGEIVDLDAVADFCGKPVTYWSHSGPVTIDYKDVDDYVARVNRKYTKLCDD